MPTELAPIERAKQALTVCATEAALAELAAKSRDIVTITNADGYQQVHGARMALKTMRVTIEKTGKAAREDATAFQKAVIAEERRLIGIIAPEEERLGTLQTAWDEARAAEKRAKEEAERARVQAIQTKLAKLAALPEVYTSALPPTDIARVIEQIEGGLTFDYQEFAPQAEAARQAALVALRRSHVEAVEREEREAAEEAARAAKAAQEAAEAAEREAKAKAAREAEEKRLREERARFEAEQAEARRKSEAERARIAEEERKAREAREAEEARLRAQREAEEAKLAEQRAELERQQREQAERQAEIERKEREAKAAEEERAWLEKREEERKAAEAARERADQERRAELRRRVSGLTAESIVRWIASELGCYPHEVAARIAEIPSADWLALTHQTEAA